MKKVGKLDYRDSYMNETFKLFCFEEINENENFTCALDNVGIQTGWCVAFSETQNCGPDDWERVYEHACNNGRYIGGWYDSSDNRYYLDSVTIIQDKEEAIKFGREQGQKAIFHTKTKELIYL